MKLKLFHYLMGVIVALLWLPMRGYGQSPPTDLNFYVNHTTSSNSSDGYIEVSVAPEGNNELVPYDFILQTNLGTVIRIQEEVTFPSGSNRTVTFENLSQGIYCVEVTKYANDCTEIAGKCDLEVEACANPSACLSPNFFVEYDGCEVQFLDASAGDISSWDWNFGDGNFESGAYLSDPVHEYYSAGSYLVTMTITDENGVQNSISKTVSVSCGNGDGNPDCSINAPSFVSLGQTFLISGEAFDGVGPYTYEWELPFELNHFQLFGPGPHHITISENSFLHNGDNITIFLRVYDAFGNYSSCSRDITISGQIPEIDLLVFPNLDGEPFPPDSYMCFVVFADTWNLSLDACYQFNVVKIIDTDGNTEAVGGFPSNCQYSWDYCDATFTTGHYQVCVDVRDGPAVYQDCEIFVVGDLTSGMMSSKFPNLLFFRS